MTTTSLTASQAVEILRGALVQAEAAIKGREHTGFITKALVATENIEAAQSAPGAGAVLTSDQVIDLLLFEVIIDSGAIMLRNGEQISFSLDELTLFANHVRSAAPIAAQEPVAEVRDGGMSGIHIAPLVLWEKLPDGTKLYTAPPALAHELDRAYASINAKNAHIEKLESAPQAVPSELPPTKTRIQRGDQVSAALAASRQAPQTAANAVDLMAARKAMFKAFSECVCAESLLPQEIADRLLAAQPPQQGVGVAVDAGLAKALRSIEHSMLQAKNPFNDRLREIDLTLNIVQSLLSAVHVPAPDARDATPSPAVLEADKEARLKVADALGFGPPHPTRTFAWDYLLMTIRELAKLAEDEAAQPDTAAVRDATRWRETLKHIGLYAGWWQIQLRHGVGENGIDIDTMERLFTEAIDAQIEATQPSAAPGDGVVCKSLGDLLMPRAQRDAIAADDAKREQDYLDSLAQDDMAALLAAKPADPAAWLSSTQAVMPDGSLRAGAGPVNFVVSPAVPADQVVFMQGGKEVGRIVNIGTTPAPDRADARGQYQAGIL